MLIVKFMYTHAFLEKQYILPVAFSAASTAYPTKPWNRGGNRGGIPEILKAVKNGTPGRSIKVPGIAQVARAGPAILGVEPGVLGGGGWLMKFC